MGSRCCMVDGWWERGVVAMEDWPRVLELGGKLCSGCKDEGWWLSKIVMWEVVQCSKLEAALHFPNTASAPSTRRPKHQSSGFPKAASK